VEEIRVQVDGEMREMLHTLKVCLSAMSSTAHSGLPLPKIEPTETALQVSFEMKRRPWWTSSGGIGRVGSWGFRTSHQGFGFQSPQAWAGGWAGAGA